MSFFTLTNDVHAGLPASLPQTAL